MDEDSFPHIPVALLERLDALFPERCADQDQTERSIFHQAGQRSVIRLLIRISNAQAGIDPPAES
jgi:hypothetical protein